MQLLILYSEQFLMSHPTDLTPLGITSELSAVSLERRLRFGSNCHTCQLRGKMACDYSWPGFAEPALPLIGHTQTHPQILPRGDTH